MINEALIAPKGIVIVGGSNYLSKPGGKMVKNLLEGGYQGDLFIVNTKDIEVQGQRTIQNVEELPKVDLAILAVPPLACKHAVKILLEKKNTRAFIIISAGFGEGGEEGKLIEKEIADMVSAHNACLIGPNCIGVLNRNYHGIFTSPVPNLFPDGCDLISSSGSVATFIMEAGIINGLRFNSVFSVGNSAQTGVEEVLEYLDLNYEHGKSSPIKLLYLETVRNPNKLLKHASSLIRKGACISGIKSGSTEAGSRAAASHTGAIANSDMAVRALFRKAGIVYCSSRAELVTTACIFNFRKPKGKNIAIITHAGGSAVMLSDALIKSGMNVPPINGPEADELLAQLHPGSSVNNPIDFLATGTAEQLDLIIDYCENKFDNIDAMVVVFGSAGLFDVANVYNVLRAKLESCRKPIYPVLPSLVNAHQEIVEFIAKGYVNFPDEVDLGTALGAIYNTPGPADLFKDEITPNKKLRELIERQNDGFLDSHVCFEILSLSGIPIAKQAVTNEIEDAMTIADNLGYPLALKVEGVLHKSDVNGVLLNIRNSLGLQEAFNQLMLIPGAEGVLIQKMHRGLELFIGVSHENGLGHLVVFGLGGIFVEIFKDVRSGLVPLSESEVRLMIRELQAYPLIKGARGKDGIDEEKFIELILKVSLMIEQLPEIVELDINPLMATKDSITAVDCRIKIAKSMEHHRSLDMS